MKHTINQASIKIPPHSTHLPTYGRTYGVFRFSVIFGPSTPKPPPPHIHTHTHTSLSSSPRPKQQTNFNLHLPVIPTLIFLVFSFFLYYRPSFLTFVIGIGIWISGSWHTGGGGRTCGHRKDTGEARGKGEGRGVSGRGTKGEAKKRKESGRAGFFRTFSRRPR